MKTKTEPIILFSSGREMCELLLSVDKSNHKLAQTMMAGTKDIFIFNKNAGIYLCGNDYTLIEIENERSIEYAIRIGFDITKSFKNKINKIIELQNKHNDRFRVANAMEIANIDSFRLTIQLVYHFNYGTNILKFKFEQDDLPF